MLSHEFSLFNLRTSGEAIADAEWRVVEENVELTSGGEMTRRGFADLHLLEAEDAQGKQRIVFLSLSLYSSHTVVIVVNLYHISLNKDPLLAIGSRINLNALFLSVDTRL